MDNKKKYKKKTINKPVVIDTCIVKIEEGKYVVEF